MKEYKILYYNPLNGINSWIDKGIEKLEKSGWEVEQGRFHLKLIYMIETDDLMKRFKELLFEFEKLSGADIVEDGCRCDPPHCFYVYELCCGIEKCMFIACGDELLEYMYDDVPKSYRKAVEKLNGGVI